jgi:HlyD family secretion protein
MKKTIIITIIIVVIASVSLGVYVRLTSVRSAEKLNTAVAIKGSLEISVSGEGELIAEKSVDIMGPNIVGNFRFRVSPLKVLDMVPEGTIVKKGDYVASLDRSSFQNTFKDETEILKSKEKNLDIKLIDSAVVLSALRNDIYNQGFSVEQASIALDQSKYEPPAVQRQAQLELDKSNRYLSWKQSLYLLRSVQTVAEIRNLSRDLEQQRRKVKDLEKILSAFTVTSPADGMVIYKKDWSGVKIKTGSFISPYNPVIASLPDLSEMNSKLYVSEIDVNKLYNGQSVQLTVNAFQGKTFRGHVSSIANIGEQLLNSDSKMFEVLVRIDNSDQFLRPAMTTSNKVILKVYNDVVFVPVESVLAGADSITFVFTKDRKRQIVIPGESDDKNIIIEAGLKPGTSVWTTIPDNANKFTLAGNDLVPVIRERERAAKIVSENSGRQNSMISEADNSQLVTSPAAVLSGIRNTSGL